MNKPIIDIIESLKDLRFVPNMYGLQQNPLVVSKLYSVIRSSGITEITLVMDFREYKKKIMRVWVFVHSSQSYTKKYDIWKTEELKPVYEKLKKSNIRVIYEPV